MRFCNSLKQAVRRFGAAVVLGLFLAAGCLADDEGYEEAKRENESLKAEIQKLRQGNDQLNQEINRLYADREILSGHVAMNVAAALHNRLTPAQPPRQAAQPPVIETRPAVRDTRQAQTARRPQTAGRPAEQSRPAAGSPAAVAPPPDRPSGPDIINPPPSRPIGAVDWGQ